MQPLEESDVFTVFEVVADWEERDVVYDGVIILCAPQGMKCFIQI
jgi:hypothetical protein